MDSGLRRNDDNCPDIAIRPHLPWIRFLLPFRIRDLVEIHEGFRAPKKQPLHGVQRLRYCLADFGCEWLEEQCSGPAAT